MKKIAIVFLLSISIFSKNTYAQNKLEVEFKTGEDDLAVRDANMQANLKISINYKNGTAPIELQNANNNQNWPKNSSRLVAIPLPENIKLEELKSITLLRGTTSNFIEDAAADNWDLESMKVTATIKNDKIYAKYELMPTKGNARKILNRFKGGKNCNCLVTYNFNTIPKLISGTQGWIDKFPPPQTTTLKIEIGTGGDDLRGGNDNASIRIKLRGAANNYVTVQNINGGRNYGNFTNKIINKTIPNANFKITDIEAVELLHSGSGGMAADNWDIDKLKITITINGETKILIDKLGAPITRFTGDNRRKTFNVE